MRSIKLHRNELIKQFQDVRNISEFLAEYLDVEDYVNQAADFESPVKWMHGHITWFFDYFVFNKMKSDFIPVNE